MLPAVEALLREAVASHQAGRLDAAEEGYRAVLSADPSCAQAAHPLGVLLLQDGRLEDAVVALSLAVGAAPRWAEAHNNLGVALRDLGRSAEAVRAFSDAVRLRPGLFDAHNNLAEALLDTEQWSAAREAALAAQRLDPRHPGPLLALGVAHHHQGEHQAASARLREALVLDPGNAHATSLLPEVERRLVPAWHFAMVNEEARNDAYDAALRRAVAPGSLVLEIGTGAGLVAMMAARAGAGRVVSCEAVPALADKAREIVARNGYADRVQVHGVHSTALRVGAELPERAGVLVSELFDSNLVGEEVLASLEDAHARLLAPGATVIPRAAAAWIELAGGGTLAKLVRAERCAGFDLSPLNAFSPERILIDGRHVDYERFSAPQEALRFDFRAPRHPESEVLFEVPVTREGVCHGVIQWLRIELDDEATYENRPRLGPAGPSSWQHAFFAFSEPLRVTPGVSVRLRVRHNRKALRVERAAG